MGDRISCLEQKKLLDRAERNLVEAEQKVKLVQKCPIVLPDLTNLKH